MAPCGRAYSFIRSLGLKSPLAEPIVSVQGSVLNHSEYEHPFLPRKGRAILADYVSSEDGTGIVHIAPGHGEEDYKFGHLENNLAIFSPVDSKGRFTDEFPYCKGEHVFKANAKITDLLREKKLLLHEADHAHSYPHCWRCKKPILFRATTQWFMKIDHRFASADVERDPSGHPLCARLG